MNVLNAMKIFRRVVELKNFTTVAREMRVSQSSVSKSVSALEEYLGITLFTRSTRQINLTDLGQEYYFRCCQVLEDLEEAEWLVRSKKSQLKGLLRMTVPVTFGRQIIAPLVWRFMEKYPEINVELHLDDRHIDLVKDGVDLAIRSGVPIDSSLIAQKLSDITRVTVASPQYLDSVGEINSLEDLAGRECIIYTGQVTQNEWIYLRDGVAKKVLIQGRIHVNSPEVSVDAALNGLGISASPLWLVRDHLKDGRLKQVLTEYSPIPYQVHALYPERKYIPEKVRIFINFLKQEIKTVLTE